MSNRFLMSPRIGIQGFTLMELIVFISIIGIGLGVLVRVFSSPMATSVDPLAQLKAVECAQAQMEAVMARRYDKNTPPGGIPACGSDAGKECSTQQDDANTQDNDLRDFNLASWTKDSFFEGCTLKVSVVNQGGDFKYLSGSYAAHAGKALASDQARLITVTATVGNEQYKLKTYRINF